MTTRDSFALVVGDARGADRDPGRFGPGTDLLDALAGRVRTHPDADTPRADHAGRPLIAARRAAWQAAHEHGRMNDLEAARAELGTTSAISESAGDDAIKDAAMAVLLAAHLTRAQRRVLLAGARRLGS